MPVSSEAPTTRHSPVLLQPVIDALCPAGRELQRFIDGTVGGGGHSFALLHAGFDAVLGMDLDRSALEQAEMRLAEFGERARLVHGSYVDMAAAAKTLGWESVDAVLLDLGLSSLQMDAAERGFAFRHDAPLDMRFDQSANTLTAAELVNRLPEAELARLLRRYGELRQARQIARAIVARRPLRSTGQLAALVADAARWRRKPKIHPATLVFQALRIAVNGELEAVERVLPIAIDLLRPGGRLAVISFHSLEDRIVKQTFRQLSTSVAAPPGMASIQERQARVKRFNRKPIAPSEQEIAANPRSRSAKLRVVEKLECL